MTDMNKDLDSVETRDLTFGERAVGLTFNPGNNGDVHDVKTVFAELVDLLNTKKEASTDLFEKSLYDTAIKQALSAQMWAVKAITFSSK